MKKVQPLALRLRRGFSIIEVLIVIVLFSFGLLGLVALQARALQVSVNAEDSQRAAMLANELVATMWGANTVNLDSAVVSAWQTRVADSAGRGLPGGTGTVTITGGNLARITVGWRPPSLASSASGHRYITEVLIP
jgi:type IV pilus assembly protein PilV